MIRFFVNLVVTFSLVILLITPGVFSGNLVEFIPQTGILLTQNSEKFGNWVQLKVNGNQFNLELTQFEKPAYFGEIITVENKGQTEITAEIVNYNPGIGVFFDTGASTTSGPQSVKLAAYEKVGISLLLPAGPAQTVYTSFSLRTN